MAARNVVMAQSNCLWLAYQLPRRTALSVVGRALTFATNGAGPLHAAHADGAKPEKTASTNPTNPAPSRLTTEGSPASKDSNFNVNRLWPTATGALCQTESEALRTAGMEWQDQGVSSV